MRFLFALLTVLLVAGAAAAQTPNQDALRAFDALRTGDWTLANTYATRALDAGTLAPGDQAAVYGYRGDARRHLEQLQDAVLDYTRALDIGLPPTYAARVYNNRGMAMFAADLFANAVDDYSNAIRLDPKFSEAYVNRGVVYMMNGRIEPAFQDFADALKANPSSGRAHSNRGQAYMQLEYYEEAIADFTAALEVMNDPEEAVVPLFNRGLAWEALGEEDEAYEDFALAYQVAPDEPTYQDKYLEYGLLR